MRDVRERERERERRKREEREMREREGKRERPIKPKCQLSLIKSTRNLHLRKRFQDYTFGFNSNDAEHEKDIRYKP